MLFKLIILFQVSTFAIDNISIGNGEWAPYQSENLPSYGPISRIVLEAFKESGVAVKYRFSPWKRNYQLTTEHIYDASIVWSKTKGREQDVFYSDVVFDIEDTFFYRSDLKNFDFKNMNSLKSLRIGTSLGYDYGSDFKDAHSNGIFSTEESRTDLSNIQKISLGRIDAFPCAKLVCESIIHKELSSDLKHKVLASKIPFRITPMYLIVSRKHKDAQEILQKFNEGLIKLKENGRYKILMESFSSIPNSP